MACLWGIAPGSRKTRRRGRNSRLDNGWFLIAFTLVFGHACALLVTALVSKAQARAAARRPHGHVRRHLGALAGEVVRLAARESLREVEDHGVLGLRVAGVAARA